jgi:excisionase family DNA binding protein
MDKEFVFDRFHSIDELPLVLSVREAAKVMKIGRDHVYDLVRSGQLKSIQVGNRNVIPREAIALFLQVKK